MTGALPMIRDGLFDIAKPDYALGMHVNPFINVGQAVVQEGRLWVSRDVLRVRTSREPAPRGTQRKPFPLAVAELIADLHRDNDAAIRNADDESFLVASVSAEQGRFNQPDSSELTVNFGTHDPGLRESLHAAVRDVVRRWADRQGATYEIEAEFAIPPLRNDAGVAAVVRRVTVEAIGEENIVTGWHNPIADDFAFYSTTGAGCYILIGTRNEAKGITAAWHTSEYDMDEDALPLGVQIISGTVLELLKA
jgi:amidohydrolase